MERDCLSKLEACRHEMTQQEESAARKTAALHHNEVSLIFAFRAYKICNVLHDAGAGVGTW